jgi:hypothetical protein
LFWWFCALVSAGGIVVLDNSFGRAGVWLGLWSAFSELCLPRLVRRAQTAGGKPGGFFLDVAMAWALLPGPLVGSQFALVSAWMWGWPSAFLACLVWFFLGPLVAALEGLVIAAIIVGVVFVATGKRLDRD